MEIENIRSAKYNKFDGENCSISVVLNDNRKLCCPLVVGNTEFDEIMRLVDAGELTIEPADE